MYLIKKRFSPIKSIVLVFFLFFNLSSYSQNFRNFTSINNKKNISFNCAVQNSDGVLWFGTSEGLIKYDGEKFKIFSQEKGLNESPVSALFFDKENTLWIGHKNGKITIFKNNKFSSFEYNHQPTEDAITCITEASGIWFSTYGSGIFHYTKDNNKTEQFNSDNGLSDNSVYTLCTDNEGNVWAGTDAGLTHFVLKNNKPALSNISMKNGLPDNIVRKIIPGKNKDMWIAMQDSGICQYDFQENKFKNINSNWSHGTVTSLYLYDSETIYFGTAKNGIFKFRTSTVENKKSNNISNIESDFNNEINSIFKDRENNIWILAKKGLAIMTQSRMRFLNHTNGLANDTVLSLFIDSKNNYWVGTNKGLISYSIDEYDETINSKLILKEKIYNKETSCIYEDEQGQIWFGTYGNGLFRYNPVSKKLENIQLNTENGNDNISCITEDKNHTIWASTLGGGISGISYINNKQVIKHYSIANGLPGNYIYSILSDNKGKFWIGTDGIGLIVYSNGSFVNVSSKNNIKGKSVYSITQSKQGNVWFNISENGIFKFDGKSLINYSTRNGLKDNNPLVLASYGDNIITAHSSGIDVLNEKTNKFRYFSFDENVTEPNLNAGYTDRKGNIWIGTNSGIIVFRSTDISSDTITPLVKLTSILVQNKEYAFDSAKNFSYDQNNFVFNYDAIWFRSEEKIKFRYQIEQIDKNYFETESKVVSYSGLQPGDYTFRLSAENSEGYWSTPTTYKFTISKPFWQKWWVWFLAILLLIFILYIFIQYRIKLLQKEKQLLEEKVEERTKEILMQSKIIEEKNKDITDSIEYAKRIQKAFLPDKKVSYNGTPLDTFIFFKPKDIVSGDFYWIEKWGDQVLFAAADCTGHGVPGALMSVIANNILSDSLNILGLSKPGLLLDNTNKQLARKLNQNSSGTVIRDGMDIALCAINFNLLKLEYAGANNPLWIVRNKELIEYKADKFPIGEYIENKNQHFTTQEIELKKEDMIYIFSDGFADQFGGAKGKKLKYKPLKEKLITLSDKPLTEQEQSLEILFNDWKGNLEQTDDVLVIGIRV